MFAKARRRRKSVNKTNEPVALSHEALTWKPRYKKSGEVYAADKDKAIKYGFPLVSDDE
jgi:hypothetical protein